MQIEKEVRNFCFENQKNYSQYNNIIQINLKSYNIKIYTRSVQRQLSIIDLTHLLKTINNRSNSSSILSSNFVKLNDLGNILVINNGVFQQS